MTLQQRDGIIEHTIGADGVLQISTTSGELEVRGVDGDVVRIAATDPDDASALDQFEVEAAEGSLRVRPPRGGFIGVDVGSFKWGRRFGGGPQIDLTIEVPRAARVDLASVSGDVHATGLTGPQRYKTVSGDLEIEAGSGPLEIDGTSGDVGLRAAGPVAMRVRTVSGDVDVRAPSVRRLEAQTMSGDVRVEAPFADGVVHKVETVSGDTRLITGSGLTIEARTVSGDIRSDTPHRTASGSGRRAIVLGDGSARLEFRSLSGDLQIVGRASAAGVAEGASWRGTMDAASTASPAPTAGPPARPSASPPTVDAVLQQAESQAPLPTDPRDAARMAILRALEAGEIDVPTATARLSALDEEVMG